MPRAVAFTNCLSVPSATECKKRTRDGAGRKEVESLQQSMAVALFCGPRHAQGV